MKEVKKYIKPKAIDIGDIYPTNEGGSVKVIEYIDSRNVLVEHMDEHKHRAVVQADVLRGGRVKNPYHPSLYGVGYIGSGLYPTRIDGKNAKEFELWKNMIIRCYDPKSHVKRPTYKDCKVNVDWHNFQVFAAWYNEQSNCHTEDYELDKDLIDFSNKEYGPDKCSLVPRAINSLLGDSARARGDLPQGVHLSKGRYQVQIRINGEGRKHLGSFGTPEEASKVYNKAKEEYVRSMAEQYKDVLNPRVYDNLMNYKVIN